MDQPANAVRTAVVRRTTQGCRKDSRPRAIKTEETDERMVEVLYAP